jgi:glycosyltransferase involved in cell wall biosynthesis
MDLKNVSVMIDGYNLRLPQGSGIKSYGLTLIRALEGLGADVSLLMDRRKPRDRVPELGEVLFFDARQELQKAGYRGLHLAAKALSLLIGLFRPEEIRLNRVIIDERYGGVASVRKFYNLQNCYELANGLFQTMQLVTRIRLPGRVDIWHATYPLPIKVSKVRKVTTIHDLVPLRLPYTTLDDKSFFYQIVKESIKNSDLIITVSNNTKNDLMLIYNIDPNKIVVTYQPILIDGYSQLLWLVNLVLRKYELGCRKYVLFVGNIEPKKNVARIIEAFAGIETDISLVIVGRKAWLWEDQIGRAEALLGKSRCKRHFKLLDYIPREDLEILYANALFFIYPSLYEGFGLPPLEAMSCGCPVISSNISSLPEVCGDAALYVDPYDVGDIRAKMESLLSDESLRRQLAEKGQKRVEFFNMPSYQKRLYDAYSRVL